MSPPKKVDVDPEEQTVLREWRELVVEHYSEDIGRLEGMEDSVHGFHIEHRLIDEKPTLRHIFHENPTRALELGFRIMREQFDAHNIPTRPVLRVIGLSDNYLNRVDELRMRDRNDLVCLDVKINEVSHPYGWLKLAKYRCLDCRSITEVKQRRARERESPRVCRPCLDKVFEDLDKKDLPMGMFHPRPNFEMMIEECKYEDVQDISMSQITYNKEHHLINCSTRNQIFGTVADDLVDQIMSSTYLRVNGIVRVQPVPDRTFSKDTRRLLSIDILSVEELPISE
jgi:DNA replicative helicase MCM subunit Mcm2 (Cdc46/Mcm family)